VSALRKRMEDLQRRNYNPDTIRGYVLAVEQFANHFDKSPELMGVEEIGQFQLHLLREKNTRPIARHGRGSEGTIRLCRRGREIGIQ